MGEYKWAYEESLQARLVLLKLLYSLALASLPALAVWPALIEHRAYRLVLAYSLSIWATASVGPEILLLVYRKVLGEDHIIRVGEYLIPALYFYPFVVYPLVYLAYAAIAVRAFEPILGGVDLASIHPRLYRLTTITAGILGLYLLVLGLITLSVAAFPIPYILMPGAALTFMVLSRHKRGAYRFLVFYPILGQSIVPRWAEAPIFWFFLVMLPEALFGRNLNPRVCGLTDPFEFRGCPSSFYSSPIPGYGVIYDAWDFPPFSITGTLLLLEWIMFAKTLLRSIED